MLLDSGDVADLTATLLRGKPVLEERVDEYVRHDPFDSLFDGLAEIDFFEDDEQEEFKWEPISKRVNKRDDPATVHVVETGATPQQLDLESNDMAVQRQIRRDGSAGRSAGWKSKYQNGKIPLKALTPLKGYDGHYLRSDAATAFNAMVKAAAAAGIDIGVTDSYRDFATQVQLAKPPSQGGKGLYSQGGLAAVPGTSEHGWGLATDLALSQKAQAWMNEHAAEYGFHTIPREPWHWEYRGGYDAAYRDRKSPKRRRRATPQAPDPRTVRDGFTPPSTPEFTATTVFPFAQMEVEREIQRQIRGTQKKYDREGHVQFKGFNAQQKGVYKELKPYLREAAKMTGLPLELLEWVVWKETTYRPEYVYFEQGSSAGAQGPMQIMPLWTSTYGDKFLRDVRTNVLVGAQILADYIEDYGVRDGLAAYNGGPGNRHIAETQAYAADIIERWKD